MSVQDLSGNGVVVDIGAMVPGATDLFAAQVQYLIDNNLLTGIGGSGSIPDGSITLAKMANLAAGTMIGRASGAGTGVPQALVDTQVRTLQGLGSMATQGAGAVAITGGSIAGITDLAVADGGTGQTLPNLARVALNQGTVALTDAATIATDCSLGNKFTVTLGGNRTLGLPTNILDGATYIWIIKQSVSGNNTIAFNAAFIFEGGVDPVASVSANAVDLLSGVAISSSQIMCSYMKGFA